MTIRAIQTGNQVGPYSPAVVATGSFVFVSGQGSIVDGQYRPGTVAEETKAALDNLTDLVRRAGSRPDLVVQCRIFLSDIADFAAVNEVYAEYFGEPYPARTTVQAGALPLGVRVEIECVAAVVASDLSHD
ncbi:Rid family detoxifying hydrolase [Amycolatopsis sp. NPDC051071]|uniref:RidA family protein n=1 Tax=Amycolatopsis sp. NPDC051071 TaxID=3154637 RepID=UPI00341EDFD3